MSAISGSRRLAAAEQLVERWSSETADVTSLVLDREVDARTSDEPSCAQCEEPFEPSRSDARFCSPACRQRAYRARQRGPTAPELDGERAASKQRLVDLLIAAVSNEAGAAIMVEIRSYGRELSAENLAEILESRCWE